LDAARLDRLLSASGRPWDPALTLASTGSTQQDLRRDVAERPLGLHHWRVLTAEVQSQGKGRAGAAWVAAPGSSVLMTLAASLPLPPWLWPRASLAAGLGALDALPNLGLRLKWPNDLLFLGTSSEAAGSSEGGAGSWRKLGGILCERIVPACSQGVWLCGIGLNVTEAPAHLPEVGVDLLGGALPAVSLRDLGGPLDRTALAAALCIEIRREVEAFCARQGRLDSHRLESHLAFLGEPIAVDLGAEGQREVLLEGLDASGGLRVRALTPGAPAEVLSPLHIRPLRR